MLRNFTIPLEKKLSVPPLKEVKETKVRVKVLDPITSEELGEKDEFVITAKELDPQSQVRPDDAEMYSIENMQKLGIPPVVANSHYIQDDVSSYFSAQQLSIKLVAQVEKADYLKSLENDPLFSTPSTESSKSE